MADADWHYALGNEQFGPVTPEALQELIQKGTLTRADRVWRPGMNQWMPAGDLAILEQFFSGPSPQFPTPQNYPAAPAPQYPGNLSTPMPLPQPMPYIPGMLPYQSPMQYGANLYAGFWRRVAAYLIDAIALDVVLLPIQFATGAASFSFAQSPNALAAYTGTGLIGTLLTWIILWLYFSLMESSSLQATLGKLALGIRVTDGNGQRIGFGTATGRFFAKILSMLTLCIGFMMAGWTEKKQALHDFIANTLVILKP